MKYLYTMKHLMNRLKEEGLPYTWATIKRYEEIGVLLSPDYIVEFGTWDQKLYERETIDSIIDRVERYRNRRISKRKCSVLKCDKNHYAKGFCLNHYSQRRYLEKKMVKVR